VDSRARVKVRRRRGRRHNARSDIFLLKVRSLGLVLAAVLVFLVQRKVRSATLAVRMKVVGTKHSPDRSNSG
jgi:hypothetical protein